MILNKFKHVIGSGMCLALLVLLTVVFFTGCGEEVVEKEVIRPVKVFKAGNPLSGLSGRAFPGRAQANEEVDLGFEVGGVLIERPVDKGDEVKKGQLLARLDPRDFKNELAAARAERERASSICSRRPNWILKTPTSIMNLPWASGIWGNINVPSPIS